MRLRKRIDDQLFDLPLRGQDEWGSGSFGASRGKRKHNGIDYACNTGDLIASPVSGVVTRLGYPYADDLSFRYVEVTTHDRLRHRVFYIHPALDIKRGERIYQGKTLGSSQDLGVRYKGIPQHAHYEVKAQDGGYLNPDEVTHG